MKYISPFILLKAGLATSLLASNLVFAQSQTLVDADSDGLIEIYTVYDLDSMRYEPHGKTFRGSSFGCPATGCFGFELANDLDFDTNNNGQRDSGDYNGGNSWMPILSNSDFYFDGNSHSIKNFFNDTPVINGALYHYGLIASFNGGYALVIKNLRLINSKIVINSDALAADKKIYAGTIGGEFAKNSVIENVYIEKGLVSFNRSSNLPALEAVSIGGVAGVMRQMVIQNTRFDGDINVVDSVQHFVGGIAASISSSSVTWVRSHGKITGSGPVGGLFADLSEVDVFGSYSTVDVVSTGEYASGGISATVLGFSDNTGSFENVYFAGSLAVNYGGSLIGFSLFPNRSFEIKSSYGKSVVNVNGKKYAQLIGFANNHEEILNFNSYDVVDPEGVELPLQDSSYTNPVHLSALKCATNSVSESCFPPGLPNWNPVFWNFGSDSELPRLILPSNYPWHSTDRPNSSGDHESLDRMKKYAPQYACDTPLDFQVKAKKSSYVFSAKTPEIFDFFNAVQGLQCSSSKQVDSLCENYEVSYLCDDRAAYAGVKWTGWRSDDDNKTNGGDVELLPKDRQTCGAGGPVGIRARVKGESAIYYGAPQKSSLSLKKGFTCLNDDNGKKGKENCKDYEVRMVCNVNSLLSNP